MTNYGVFFKDVDEYDYNQHLKIMGEYKDAVYISNEPKKVAPKTTFQLNDVQLSDEVFAAKEQSVGLMNQQEHDLIVTPDLDPSIREALTALDDDEYVEDDLEDDFFDALDQDAMPDKYVHLEQEQEEEEEEEGWFKEFKKYKKQAQDFSDSDDDLESHSTFRPTKAGTMASAYSMSSSSMFRNDKLTLLDDQFDKILRDYSDDEVGELDPEDPEVLGALETLKLEGEEGARLECLFDEFLGSTRLNATNTRLLEQEGPGEVLDYIREELKQDARKVMDKYSFIPEIKPGEEEPLPMPEEPRRDTWDVETVLTGYTNIYNRPIMIEEFSKNTPQIRLKGRFKMPNIQEETPSGSEDDEPKLNKGAAIPRDESKEEKKLRKAALKAERRVLLFKFRIEEVPKKLQRLLSKRK